MSAWSDQASAILGHFAAAVPGIKTDLGSAAWDEWPPHSVGTAFIMGSVEQNEAEDYQQTYQQFTIVVGMIRPRDVTAEQVWSDLDAVLALANADRTLGGLVDSSYTSERSVPVPLNDQVIATYSVITRAVK